MGFYIFILHDLCLMPNVALILSAGPATYRMLAELFEPPNDLGPCSSCITLQCNVLIGGVRVPFFGLLGH